MTTNVTVAVLRMRAQDAAKAAQTEATRKARLDGFYQDAIQLRVDTGNVGPIETLKDGTQQIMVAGRKFKIEWGTKDGEPVLKVERSKDAWFFSQTVQPENPTVK